jgi:hypothetical protein
VGSIFKLKNRSRAILSENDQRSVIPIPARATVVLWGGDMDFGGKIWMRMLSSRFAMAAKFYSCSPKIFVAA